MFYFMISLIFLFGVVENMHAKEKFSKVSLDEIEKNIFRPGPSPLDYPAEEIILTRGTYTHPIGTPPLVLDGIWQMACGGEEKQRLNETWPDAMQVNVPGSVHTALIKAGLIPDPYVGMNDAIARSHSFKSWWFKKEFDRPIGTNENENLIFEGVAVSCAVWINNCLLGTHNGMFGGPSFHVAPFLKEKNNTLIVRIDPAPYLDAEGRILSGSFFNGMNVGWIQTAVFNNCYGWHYSNIPALGIWRPVKIEVNPTVKIENPFIATRDAQKGIVDLCIKLRAPNSNNVTSPKYKLHNVTSIKGRLAFSIEPENFQGQSYHFVYDVDWVAEVKFLNFRFAIPEVKLWWPNGLGEQNLYRLKISFVPSNSVFSDFKEIVFGVRTIHMLPLPQGASPELYNWTFVINNKPIYINGANWCTVDTLMDFSRQRYDRFLLLAKMQNVRMLRAWGSGMPETDYFYELCDRYGILVMQEWPTAWDSHFYQPYSVLEETVRLNTLRLRNHPSLIMWGAGNESGSPFGETIDMMGRYAYELDGTRPFHRGEPRGGSFHSYVCSWGRQPLDNNLDLKGIFCGEFGLHSTPSYESILRYLPEDERKLWPAPENKSFAYHMPVFNKMGEYETSRLYAYQFVEENCTMEQYAVGSQLSQVVGLRHPLELGRTRWPECTGMLYYKLNDNYPAVSWSTIDWYGAPKIAYYFIQDAFAPLHGCVLFETLNVHGREVSLPVFLLDDAGIIKDQSCEVEVCAYNAELKQIKRHFYAIPRGITEVYKAGTFILTADQTSTIPLFVTVTVRQSNHILDSTFYWLNYEAQKGCLFTRPKTKLIMDIKDNIVIVKNIGNVPAIAVHLYSPQNNDKMFLEDNYFWLEPNQEKRILFKNAERLFVSCWNDESK